MKVGIMTFEQFHGRRGIGGSRIRGRWIAKYWEDAEIFTQGRKYDVVIYQKAYWVEHAREFKGLKIFDICDPDWLHWSSRFMEMVEECDVVTTSTEALAEDIKRYTDKVVVFIPDRMDLEYHKEKKVHKGNAKTVVWFGYSCNFEMLQSAVAHLASMKLNLIVISDKNFIPGAQYSGLIKVTNHRWREDTVNQHIIEGDIVINPRATKGKWKYKSNNKTITAQLLNMPVAENLNQLKEFVNEEARIKESDEKFKLAIQKYDVRLSVSGYKLLITKMLKIKDEKN